MISVILAFLRTHWMGASIAATGFGVFTYIAVQHIEIDRLRKKVSESAAENITLTNTNNALAVSIHRQNNAIEAIRGRAGADAKAASAERARAQKTAQSYRLKAQAIQAKASSGDECADLKSLVRGYISGVP